MSTFRTIAGNIPPGAGQFLGFRTQQAANDSKLPPNASLSVPATKHQPESKTQLSRKQEGQKFVSAFGPNLGPKFFAAGYSFTQALAEHIKSLKAENTSLKAESAKLKSTQSTGGRRFVAGALSEGAAKYAAGIKLPNKAE